MKPFFEKPTIKMLGIVAFAGLLGFAVGNGHETTDAMAGQAAWLNDRCGKTVKAKVQQHIQLDRQTFGYAPEDLKK